LCLFFRDEESLMLVLTRKPGQSVYIGTDIKVTLHGIRGNQVRLGIDAPGNVRIYREEIFNQILEENQSAASELPPDLTQVAKVWADGRSKALSELAKHKNKKRSTDDFEDED
jgi:carbon storage regulator